MDYASQPFVMEHITPVSEDGDTTLENLALACGGCSSHKYNKVEGLDPISKTQVLLYHPRQQNWHDHFRWSADYLKIIGVTAVGRATVDTLKLNRPGIINLRKLLLMASAHPPKEG
jgi:HNH endonuclease